MLGERIRQIRKQKGITQEELAFRLHVVRQTVSKWEKNLSVPDAEMLSALADELEVSVNDLLGADIPEPAERNELAEQLARINEQLVIKNRRARRIWKTIAVVLAVFVLGTITMTVLGLRSYKAEKDYVTVTISLAEENPEYTEEDIEAAIDIVTREFQKEYNGCKLISISYDEEYSRSQAERWKTQYETDQIIILLSSFSTNAQGGDGSFEPNSTYTDWQWILTRTRDGRWTLQDAGYA